MSGRILVVGNASINVVLEVDAVPADGETVVAAQRRHDIGGKGANQAVAAARAGARVTLVARIGADEEGRRIRAALAVEGVDTNGCVVDEAPTNCSYVVVERSGRNRIISVHAPAGHLTAPALSALGGLGPSDLLLVQGNLEGAVATAVLSRARTRGVHIVLNAASLRWPLDPVLPLIDTLIVNEAEALQVTGSGPETAATSLCSRGVGRVVVTLGARGALLQSAAQAHRVDAPDVVAVDSVGAGDVLCGVWCAGTVAGMAPHDALRRAVQAASIAVTRRGTQSAFPTRDEIAALTSG